MHGQPQTRAGTIWLLGFGLLGTSLLWSTYNAYVPIFLQAGRADFTQGAGVRGFGLSATAAGFVMTLDNLAAMLILPFVGALSDRTRTRLGRRRPYILAGAPVAAIAFATIPFLLGGPLALFMAAIVMTLLAMDSFRTPVIALMPDLVPPERRSPANGIINLMGGVGAALAFVAAERLWRLSPAAPFLAAAAGMLAASLIVVATIREPEVPFAPEESPGFLETLRSAATSGSGSLRRLIAAIFVWFLSYTAIETFFTSFAVQQFRLTPGGASQLLLSFTGPILLGALPAGIVGARLGRRSALAAGLAVFAAALFWGYTIHDLAQMRIMLALAGLAWAVIIVNALPFLLDFAPAESQGTYTGLYYLASMASAVAGPILAGQIVDHTGGDYRILFLYGPATLAVAIALLHTVRAPSLAAGPPA